MKLRLPAFMLAATAAFALCASQPSLPPDAPFEARWLEGKVLKNEYSNDEAAQWAAILMEGKYRLPPANIYNAEYMLGQTGRHHDVEYRNWVSSGAVKNVALASVKRYGRVIDWVKAHIDNLKDKDALEVALACANRGLNNDATLFLGHAGKIDDRQKPVVAYIYAQGGDKDYANVIFAECLAKNPNPGKYDFEGQRALAYYLSEKGDKATLAKFMQQMAKKPEKLSTPELLEVASSFVEAGKPSDADKLIEKLMKRDLRSPDWLMLTEYYDKHGKTSERDNCFRRIDPTSFSTTEEVAAFMDYSRRLDTPERVDANALAGYNWLLTLGYTSDNAYRQHLLDKKMYKQMLDAAASLNTSHWSYAALQNICGEIAALVALVPDDKDFADRAEAIRQKMMLSIIPAYGKLDAEIMDFLLDEAAKDNEEIYAKLRYRSDLPEIERAFELQREWGWKGVPGDMIGDRFDALDALRANGSRLATPRRILCSVFQQAVQERNEQALNSNPAAADWCPSPNTIKALADYQTRYNIPDQILWPRPGGFTTYSEAYEAFRRYNAAKGKTSSKSKSRKKSR